jgi:hypothetical protein
MAMCAADVLCERGVVAFRGQGGVQGLKIIEYTEKEWAKESDLLHHVSETVKYICLMTCVVDWMSSSGL